MQLLLRVDFLVTKQVKKSIKHKFSTVAAKHMLKSNDTKKIFRKTKAQWTSIQNLLLSLKPLSSFLQDDVSLLWNPDLGNQAKQTSVSADIELSIPNISLPFHINVDAFLFAVCLA